MGLAEWVITIVAEAGAAGVSAVMGMKAAEDSSVANPEVKELPAKVACTVKSAAEEVAGEASLAGTLMVYSTEALSVDANPRFIFFLLIEKGKAEGGFSRSLSDKCRTLAVVLLIFVMTMLSTSKGGLNNFAINCLKLNCALVFKLKSETLMPRSTWTAGTATTTCRAADGWNEG